MQCRSITILFIIVWVAVAILYDIIIAWRCGTEATISAIIHEWALNSPVVALALGILCGHFFWSQK